MLLDGSEMTRRLYYGDNIDVMRQNLATESVDLVYLDPPFNSEIDYNILFKAGGLTPDEAQMTAFKDTWAWDEGANEAFSQIQDIPEPSLVSIINALREALSTSPMMAYLVMMTIRLYEIKRIMKPTASIYLHCDPTASHYLKIVLDSIFGPANFLNEIIWRRTGSHNSAKRFGPIHDTLLFYRKTNQYKHNTIFRPYTKGHVSSYFRKEDDNGRYWSNSIHGAGLRNGESGKSWRGYDPTAAGRHWAVPSDLVEMLGIDASLKQHEKLDAMADLGVIDFPTMSSGSLPTYRQYLSRSLGLPAQDVWAYQPHTKGVLHNSSEAIDEDVRWLQAQGDDERLGYPTQKPIGLLERIILSSSSEGDVVFDPFAGCGTTIVAAEKLERQWIGIDISPFAIQLVRRSRIESAFPDLRYGKDYIVDGLPTTIEGAQLLADQDSNRKAFEIWCVSVLDGYPNESRGPDRGIDGRIKFRPEGTKGAAKFAVVSVKSGKLKADDIRAFISVSSRERSSSMGFGVFVCLQEPTSKMRADASSVPMIEVAGIKYPAIQIITVGDMLKGSRPRLPFYDSSATHKRAVPIRKTKSDLFK